MTKSTAPLSCLQLNPQPPRCEAVGILERAIMANDLNQCNFIGRLGRDLELRTFQSGDQVANGTLAVGSKWKDKQTGEAKESTEWVRLNFHGKSAEIAAKYLRKGSQIFVTGEMRTREWEQDGVKRYSTEIRVSNFQMFA